MWDWSSWEGANPRYGGVSEVRVGCSTSAIVVIGYVNSPGDVSNEARPPFNSREGSLKLSVKRDIITEDMLGC